MALTAGWPVAARVITDEGMAPRIDSTQLQPPADLSPQATPDSLLAAQIRQLHQQAQSRQRAARQNASWLLGLLYLHGLGVAADGAAARQWFEKAQQAGHAWAAAGLAWCAMEGCGQPPQPDQARRWLSQLQAHHPARTLYLRWWQLQQEAPLQLHPDQVPATGHSLLQQAAQAGDAQALNALGLQAVAAGEVDAARRAFERAAGQSPAAARNLQRLHMQAESAPERSDSAPGESFWRRARAYHRGDGVPVNFTEALRLYQAAAAQGHPQARQMLALIYSRPQPDGQIPLAWMQQLAHADQSLPSGHTAQLQPSDVRLYMQDPTPLYDLIPPQWRSVSVR